MTTSRPPLSYTKLAIILGTLSAFGPLSIDMYLPALPTIARDFGTETAVVQQTLAVFFIGLSLGQIFYGPISDRMGRRLPLLFGCGLYMIACIGCALAPSIESLIPLRFAQALGACAGVVICRSVVRDLFDQQESARMYSFLMLVMGLAPITAPLIGGQLLLYFGWRAIFLTLSGFGLLCLLLVAFVLPETLPVERRTRAGLGSALQVYGEILIDRRFMGFAIASTGLVGPNATAAAMAPYAKRAGSAAALLGAIQFIFGAVAGALVSALHNGTALPMTGVIALCGVSAYLVLQLLAMRAIPQTVAR